jgi:hypothetical protein
MCEPFKCRLLPEKMDPNEPLTTIQISIDKCVIQSNINNEKTIVSEHIINIMLARDKRSTMCLKSPID